MRAAGRPPTSQQGKAEADADTDADKNVDANADADADADEIENLVYYHFYNYYDH